MSKLLRQPLRLLDWNAFGLTNYIPNLELWMTYGGESVQPALYWLN